MSTKIVFRGDSYKDGGPSYTWSGGLGCWFSSVERGVTMGDVRLIRGALFAAWALRRKPRTFKHEIWWTPITCEKNTPEEMRAFKARL